MRILLLGSTGSIGTSACNCIRRFSESFTLTGLSTNVHTGTLIDQVNEFAVSSVCVCSEKAVTEARAALPASVRIYEGVQGLTDLVNETEFDILLNALVGAVGFRPTVAALKRNKRVALANKESLVIGGDIITQLLAQGLGTLVPVDSEHSAILQCCNGEDVSTIERIIITASGGPFREKPLAEFSHITPVEALNHPTWSMGKKITIDSATLVNKGFEVIEAHHLFALPYDRVQVVIHPQSIIHSLVTFHDGAVIAQCGIPDMELPIQYALSFPKRLPIQSARLDLTAIGSLTFAQPALDRFPCLRLCIEAGRAGGTAPVVLNAANEVAVRYFLDKVIAFNQIPKIIEKALQKHYNQRAESVELIEEIDHQIRTDVIHDIKKTI